MKLQIPNRIVVNLFLVLMLALSAFSASAKERITYFHNDLLGSPVAATNVQGEIVWTEEYTPHGKRLIKENSGDNSRWYTGKSEVAALGVHYFDARWYDADIGRFLSIDPADFNEGDIHSFNRYAYANNNPYRYVDPNGETPLDLVFLAVDVVKLGAAVYTGVGVAGAAADVGMSLVGVLSPVPGTGVALKSYKAAKLVKSVDKAADGVSGTKKVHGNSLNSTKPAEGYTLRDRDTGDVLKYGETTRGTKRYSQTYLEKNNADMVFEAKGTKREMHGWQHEKILEHKGANAGSRPPLNKSDY